MQRPNFKIIQLLNSEGEPAGLYITPRFDTENLQIEFDNALLNTDDQDEADEWLEENGIYRVDAEEVQTDVL